MRTCFAKVGGPSGFAELVSMQGKKRLSLPKVRLGDSVGAMLAAVGITKERVAAASGAKDCGCAARQSQLNEWGFKQQHRVEGLLNAVADFYFGPAFDKSATVDGERNAPDATQAATAEGSDEA
jgi:hypothetical protein